MKKTYEKPRAMMEYFTLSQSIANGCGWNSNDFYGHPTHADAYTCTWVGADGEVYWTEQPTCSDSYPIDIDVGEGCYNAPSGSNQIFAS